MRQESKIQVDVRGKIVGGFVPLICLPIVATKKEDLITQATDSIALDPDMLEWRMDAYDQAEDIDICLAALKELRETIGNVPLLATCRMGEEGGLKSISRENRLQMAIAVAQSGFADIVDIEMCNGQKFVDEVKQAALKNQTKLLLSFHDFTKTPAEKRLVEKLLLAQAMGADIAKVAVMPKDAADVLTLLSATSRARNGKVQIPIVTIAMGVRGKITRIAGGLFGSDITFAVGMESSAPGQLPIAELKQAMGVIY